MKYETVLFHPEDEGGGGELVAEVEAALDAEPEPAGPYSLADDAQVTWDGLEAPMSGKDIREAQMRHADYTRKTQELANQQQGWEQQVAEGQRWQQHARQLEAQMQQRQAPQAPKVDPNAQTWEQIKQQGGIPTDRELRALLEADQHGVGAMRSELNELRSQMQYFAQDYVGNTRTQLNQLLQEKTVASHEQAIRDAIKETGAPTDLREDVEELARDMFHSFEPDKSKGETMDTYVGSFPTMFADRWKRITGMSRKLDKQDLADAKKDALPRSGGAATPSKAIQPETDIADYIGQFEPEGGWTD